jgi:hypothetical protein
VKSGAVREDLWRVAENSRFLGRIGLRNDRVMAAVMVQKATASEGGRYKSTAKSRLLGEGGLRNDILTWLLRR